MDWPSQSQPQTPHTEICPGKCTGSFTPRRKGAELHQPISSSQTHQPRSQEGCLNLSSTWKETSRVGNKCSPQHPPACFAHSPLPPHSAAGISFETVVRFSGFAQLKCKVYKDWKCLHLWWLRAWAVGLCRLLAVQLCSNHFTSVDRPQVHFL